MYCSRLHLHRLLTLAAKHRQRVTAIVWRFLSVCPSVRRNPPVLNGKGHLKENMHSRYTRQKGIVVMLSPAQWCSSVQLLPMVAQKCTRFSPQLNPDSDSPTWFWFWFWFSDLILILQLDFDFHSNSPIWFWFSNLILISILILILILWLDTYSLPCMILILWL